MKTSEMVFVGIKGSVVAVNRADGTLLWSTCLKGMDFVNVIFQDAKILATCSGEIFCLDPQSGKLLWHNPLKGFGVGLATMAIEDSDTANAPSMAQKRRRDQAAASSGAIVAVTASSS
jgi:outer membrane protein assembly factor BamB